MNEKSDYNIDDKTDCNTLAQEALKAHKNDDLEHAKILYLAAIKAGCQQKELVLINLGVIYKGEKEFNRSIKCYEHALKINPSNANTYINLSSVCLIANRPDKAAQYANRGLAIESGNTQCMFNLAIALFRLGHLAKAREVLQIILKIDSKSEILYSFLANIFIKEKSDTEALKTYRIGLKMNPNSHRLYYEYGVLCHQQKNIADSLSALKEAVRLDKTNEDYRTLLTVIQLAKNAKDEYTRTKTNDIDNPSFEAKKDYYIEDNKSNKLIIAFTSDGMQLSRGEATPPTFDFYNLLKNEKQVDKLFVRDQNRQYYLQGLKHSTKDLAETISLLQRIIKQKEYTRIIGIGSSSGGFACLLYGNLLRFQKSIVFNPQTVISEEKETVIKDDIFKIKMSDFLRKQHKNDELYQYCLNLRNFMPFSTEAEIHYSSDSPGYIDKKYAEYIQHEKCKLIEHQCNHHLLALQLKEKGALINLIRQAL
ncbi:lipopolysaccharide assembly protein LapB [Prochlorococcus sp. MIT 1303]|uniref:tetratricopeptide repeat protein n=1 Tax=Prochlorococcus sp. MIT 1303 TaxID=1723647 RepID=UPI0007B3C457|nr:tetratricopeptide repeat protein [Prochlorococcus sp. MIT 1303]KZR61784.1 Photosystem I assembly protein Ycf3 [Prochlorococcus sp. MIT 1303]